MIASIAHAVLWYALAAWLVAVTVFLLAEMRVVGALEQRLDLGDRTEGAQGEQGVGLIVDPCTQLAGMATGNPEPVLDGGDGALSILLLAKPNCAPCHRLAQWLRGAGAEHWRHKMVVCIRGPHTKAAALGALFPSTVRILHDPDAVISRAVQILATPVALICNARGVVLATAVAATQAPVTRALQRAVSITRVASLAAAAPEAGPDATGREATAP